MRDLPVVPVFPVFLLRPTDGDLFAPSSQGKFLHRRAGPSIKGQSQDSEGQSRLWSRLITPMRVTGEGEKRSIARSQPAISWMKWGYAPVCLSGLAECGRSLHNRVCDRHPCRRHAAGLSRPSDRRVLSLPAHRGLDRANLRDFRWQQEWGNDFPEGLERLTRELRTSKPRCRMILARRASFDVALFAPSPRILILAKMARPVTRAGSLRSHRPSEGASPWLWSPIWYRVSSGCLRRWD